MQLSLFFFLLLAQVLVPVFTWQLLSKTAWDNKLCSNAAWAIGCVWFFCYRIRAHGRVRIQTSPSICEFLSCSLRSRTGSCGWLWHCSGSRSSCRERGFPLATAGLSAWVRQAGFEPPGIQKGRHAHHPKFTLRARVKKRKEKMTWTSLCSPDLRLF